MTERKTCPICNSEDIETVLNPIDHTVSNKEFPVAKCNACGFHFTTPIPDENEIGDYYKSEEYVSHTDTKKGVINRLYHVVRKRSIKKKERLVSRLVDGRKLLDVGSGTGEFLAYCKTKKWDVVGLEPDPDARKLSIEKGVDAREISELNNLQKESFDAVTMWHVLEHVWHLKEELKSIVDRVRPGGVLIVAVPNKNSRDAKWYGAEWAAWDVPRHLYHFTPDDIRRLADEFGMKFEEMLPMKYDAYYVSMLSEKIKDGNLIRAAWNGWRSNLFAKNGEYSSQIYVLRKPKRD